MAIKLRLDEDYARKRNELAQRTGMSKHEAVLHAIDEEYNRMTHRQRVTDALNQSVERWGTHWSDSDSNAVRVPLTRGLAGHRVHATLSEWTTTRP